MPEPEHSIAPMDFWISSASVTRITQSRRTNFYRWQSSSSPNTIKLINKSEGFNKAREVSEMRYSTIWCELHMISKFLGSALFVCLVANGVTLAQQPPLPGMPPILDPNDIYAA